MSGQSDILDRIGELTNGRTHWEGCEEEHLLCACSKELIRFRAIEKLSKSFCESWFSGRYGESNRAARELLDALEAPNDE